jgi:hypothetical protein
MKNNLLQKDGDIIYVSTRDAVKVSNEQSVFCKAYFEPEIPSITKSGTPTYFRRNFEFFHIIR